MCYDNIPVLYIMSMENFRLKKGPCLTGVVQKMYLEELLTMKRRNHQPNPFGERLRELRQVRGLTQIELGQMVGLTQRVVSHYETYVKFPPARIIPVLAKALKVTTDELLGLKSFKDESLAKHKSLMRRFRIVDEFPLRDQRTVFSLINALAAKQEARKGAGRE